MQLDPFSSFGVRNPRLSAKDPTQEKGQRQKIENSENTGEREKEMMKSPLQEKKKKKRRRRSTDPLYNTCGLFWLLVGKFFEERRRKPRVGELLLNVERNREK